MAKTWLITGSSRGFGWELAKAVLEDGDTVVATARRPEQLDDLVRQYGDRVRTCALDVTDPEAARAAVKLAVDAFGRLDVVVNNAGYATFASIEDMQDDVFRAQIEANLFGVVNLTRAALPVLRTQRSGNFIQFSSIGGRVGGTAGLSAYQTAKFGVEGFSEVLNSEVRHLGIKVTIIEPGAFRTDWGGPSARTMPVSQDYDQSVGAMIRSRDATDGRQPGDPARAAELIMGIVRLDEPPLRLLLGAGAVESAENASRIRAAEAEEWAVVSRSADFGAAAPSQPYRVRLAATVTG
jgi:NAD(P)-dependent dehydrogenase (short-subunit alcohol dehydrogenase family)